MYTGDTGSVPSRSSHKSSRSHASRSSRSSNNAKSEDLPYLDMPGYYDVPDLNEPAGCYSGKAVPNGYKSPSSVYGNRNERSRSSKIRPKFDRVH